MMLEALTQKETCYLLKKDNSSSLDLNVYNLGIGRYRSLDDSYLDATDSCLQMFVPDGMSA
eukprot:4752280-Ditylum_brightwellii.AAC.1